MKQLQKSDLKVSKIYKLKAHNREYLYRISDMRTSMTLCNDGYLIIDTNHFNKISNISQSHDFADAKYIETKEKYEFYNATPEEKHWLETCIKADKFVSYEEAMKTLIPEYVECIILDSLIEVGKVYKTTGLKDWGAPYIDGCNKVYTLEIGNNNPYYTSQFKPSTKEAYDAQFIVKESKVVLEEPKDKVLTKALDNQIIQVECSEGGVYRIGDKIKVFGGSKNSTLKSRNYLTIIGFRWNSNKTSICAITELYGTNGIGLDKIELYVEPKVKIVEDFVLPEKWCVEVNEEIRNRLNYVDIIGYHHSIRVNQYNKWSNKIKEGFTEITFEQFKKYVLKDE